MKLYFPSGILLQEEYSPLEYSSCKTILIYSVSVYFYKIEQEISIHRAHSYIYIYFKALVDLNLVSDKN